MKGKEGKTQEGRLEGEEQQEEDFLFPRRSTQLPQGEGALPQTMWGLQGPLSTHLPGHGVWVLEKEHAGLLPASWVLRP